MAERLRRVADTSTYFWGESQLMLEAPYGKDNKSAPLTFRVVKADNVRAWQEKRPITSPLMIRKPVSAYLGNLTFNSSYELFWSSILWLVKLVFN